MKKEALRLAVLAVAFSILAAPSLMAQEPEGEVDPAAAWNAFLSQFEWEDGPSDLAVGSWGTVAIPDGYHGLGPGQTQKYLRALGNMPGNVLGLVAPENGTWFVIFQFDDTGYVKDDDEDDLDADDLLDSLKEGQEAANDQLRASGLEGLEIVGFAEKPHYDKELRSLAWAIRLQSDSGAPVINHHSRILGRNGVMRVTYVVDTPEFQANLSDAKNVIRRFKFESGKRYADFRKGDKVAEYGLAALITGGGLAVAAKTGLLKKFWKVLVLGVIAIGGFFKKLFGGGSKKTRRVRRGGARGGDDSPQQ